MRKIRFILWVLVIILSSCVGTKRLAKVDIKNQESTDSITYELIVLDPGFESWYLSHSKPVWYHSQQYYETWNRQYVTFWNSKALSPHYNRYFESTIDYEPFTDYGLELNHKLFYYFQYVEKVLKINILPPGTGPQTVL